MEARKRGTVGVAGEQGTERPELTGSRADVTLEQPSSPRCQHQGTTGVPTSDKAAAANTPLRRRAARRAKPKGMALTEWNSLPSYLKDNEYASHALSGRIPSTADTHPQRSLTPTGTLADAKDVGVGAQVYQKVLQS